MVLKTISPGCGVWVSLMLFYVMEIIKCRKQNMAHVLAIKVGKCMKIWGEKSSSDIISSERYISNILTLVSIIHGNN